MLNWELLRHPYNWLIVWLMISFAVVVLTYLAPDAAHPS
jgi:hypothetical protein